MSRSNSKSAAPAVLGLAIMTPLLYVLSIGPIAWLNERGYMQSELAASTMWCYIWPLEMVAESSETVGNVLRAYVELWR